MLKLTNLLVLEPVSIRHHAVLYVEDGFIYLQWFVRYTLDLCYCLCELHRAETTDSTLDPLLSPYYFYQSTPFSGR